MPNSFFSLNRVTRPEETVTIQIPRTNAVGISAYFSADVFDRAQRAFIYCHDYQVMCTWSQTVPRVQPTTETNPSGHLPLPDESANLSIPTATHGHGIDPGQEREIIGRQQIHNLRLIGTDGVNTSKVTITLES